MAELEQWNMRGLQANREELNLLISSLNPSVIALQETNIGKHHNINFSNYFVYNCFGSEINGIFHRWTLHNTGWKWAHMWLTQLAVASSIKDSQSYLINNQTRFVLLVSNTFHVTVTSSRLVFYKKTVSSTQFLLIPHWWYTLPSVDFSLHAVSKLDTSPEILKSKFLEFCKNLHDHLHIHMDGSKANDKVAAGAVGRDVISSLCITNQASIFTPELVALV